MTYKTSTQCINAAYITDTNAGALKLSRLFDVNVVISVLKQPLLWQNRIAQRRHLLELVMDVENQRVLNDMGMTLAQAVSEARKPFWQA